MKKNQLRTLLLAGGEGTRLWPLSQEKGGKPLVSLPHKKTFLEETLNRALQFSDECWISCREADVPYFQKLLPADNIFFLAESEGKSTAAPIFAASFLLKEDPTPLLVLPIDHSGGGEKELLELLPSLLNEDHLVIFGSKPLCPSDQYGYISRLSSGKVSFIEKPSLEKAKQLLQNPHVFWNRGMLLARPSAILEEGWKCCPHMMHAIEQSLAPLQGRTYHLKGELWHQLPSISFDKAVLEKTNNCMVVLLNSLWEDLGTWKGFFSTIPEDSQGNRTVGPVTLCNSSHTCIHSSSIPVVVDGVDHLTIIASPKGIFIKKS